MSIKVLGHFRGKIMKEMLDKSTQRWLSSHSLPFLLLSWYFSQFLRVLASKSIHSPLDIRLCKFSSVQLLSRVRLFGPHASQHARPPCPSPTPRVHSNSCPLSPWCYPTVSSSVIPFSLWEIDAWLSGRTKVPDTHLRSPENFCQWLPTPVFLPGESHGERRLAGYCPWGRKESDMTERLSIHSKKTANQQFSRGARYT